MNQGFEKVDYLVKTSCESDGDVNYKTYDKRIVFAMRFMREQAGLKLNVGTNFKEKRIAMTENKRIPFPDDFVSYVMVGFIHNGNVLSLAYNPDMTVSEINDCGDATAIQGGNVTGTPNPAMPIYGGFDGGLNGSYNMGNYRYWFGQSPPHFGWGGGYVIDGDYNIDWERREFVFSQNTSIDTLLLRYMSNNYDPTSNNYLPIAAIEPGMRYIDHHYFKMLAKSNQNSMYWAMSNDAHKKFGYAMDTARRSLSNSTPEEIIQAFRRSAGGAVRI
jgi:hypothetical protein